MSKKVAETFEAPKPVREVTHRSVDAGRYCSKCGAEARIVSNSLGVTAYCGPCGTHWGISGPRFAPPGAIPPGRGISRVTMVSPDYSLAFETDTEDSPHEPKLWEEDDERSK